MITTVVGKTFLDAYNKKYLKEYSPKDFFKNEYYPLFYDNEKFLMSVTNSPFDQGYKMKRHLTIEGRKQDLEVFYEKAQSGKTDASIFLGASASDEKEFASTSGQVSDVSIPFEENQIYLSWIGSGLGIMVAGAFMILFDDADIMLQTFEGWKVYRKYLNDPTLTKLKGNQVNTWNGQWLTYSLKPEFKKNFDFALLTNENFFKIESILIEVETIKWSQLFFSLSQSNPNKSIIGYVYSFGQMNKTIGFIPFYFKSGDRIKEVYSKLFGGDYQIGKKEFENLFGLHIKRACELGSVGLQALRPENLNKYMNDSKNISFNKEEDTIIYHAYKTWLVAMLTKNKKEITDYTLELAETIKRYRNASSKTDRKNLIEQDLFGSKSKKGFIDALTSMVKDLDGQDLQAVKKLKDEVHIMTNEEYGYFCTLLKFDYAFVEKKS
jgi:hypothetical protein